MSRIIMTQIQVFVRKVDQAGAEIATGGKKPVVCAGLGGWKEQSPTGGIWWTRIKGADADQFYQHVNSSVLVDMSDSSVRVIQ